MKNKMFKQVIKVLVASLMLTFAAGTAAHAAGSISLDVSHGSTYGGTAVTITVTGATFTGISSVTIGGNRASSVVLQSSTSITALTPASVTTGAVDVVVTGTPTNTITATGGFTYDQTAPTATAVNIASIAPGVLTPVVITGTNFLTGTTVTVSGGSTFTATSVTSTSWSGSIFAPANATGSVTLTINVPGNTGSAPTLTVAIAVPPTITFLAPATGSPAGGTQVVIVGTHLYGATVTIGGQTATVFTPASAAPGDTNMVVVVPPAASGVTGSVPLVVTTTGGQATSSFTYGGTVSITSVTPNQLNPLGGDVLTVTGNNLSTTTSVVIGNTAASFTIRSNTTLQVVTPPNPAGTVTMYVNTASGYATYSLTYLGAPTIIAVTPSTGSTLGGTTVTVTGTNLTGVSTVLLNNQLIPNFTIVSNTQLTFTLPASASAGAVSLVLISQAGNATAAFTYATPIAPVVSAVTPAAAAIAGGSLVTLTGVGFTGTTQVLFGGVAGTSLSVLSDNQMTVIAPAHAAGAVSITFTNPGGSGTASFTYVGQPTITSFDPVSSPIAGGNTVTINGTGLTGTSSVQFGGTAATNIRVISDSQITVTAPAKTAGSVTVTLVSVGGSTASTYSYVTPVAPTITSTAPTSVSSKGGTTVVLNGTGFTNVIGVSISGVPLATFTVVSATQISFVTPALTAGTKTLTVTTTAGYAAASFTVTAAVPVTTKVSCSFLDFGSINFASQSVKLSPQNKLLIRAWARRLLNSTCTNVVIGRYSVANYLGRSAIIKANNNLEIVRSKVVALALNAELAKLGLSLPITYQDWLTLSSASKVRAIDGFSTYRKVTVSAV